MNTHAIPTCSQSGDFISERAARRVTAHRRPAAAPAPAVAPAATGRPAPAARQATPTPASGARILRRWSVAELIYRAAARQPVVA